MLKNKKLFLLTGESSGDLHGGALMQNLKKYDGWQMDGVGGPRMREAGMTPLFPMEELQIMGFVSVAFSLPKIIGQFRRVKEHILKSDYDGVVLIDYPGFNLRLAKALREEGYRGKLVQLISPTVWAWGKGRSQIIAKYYDRLLTIFPFEADCYSHTSLDVRYIGHPLVDKIENYAYKKNERDSNKPLIGLFPGSRLHEIKHNLPRMLELAETLPAEITVSCARDDLQEVIEKYTCGKVPSVPAEYSYELMQRCHLALAVSGTATLELALHRTPTVVLYHVPLVNGLIARYLMRIRLPHYCIANILRQKELFPEFVNYSYPKKRVKAAVEKLFYDEGARRACQAGCQEVKETLGSAGAMEKAADAIEELFHG